MDDASTASDNSSTSSDSRRQSYRSRTRLEKQKKRHGPKGNRVKSIRWWDDKKSNDKSFLTHQPPIINPAPDPVDKFDSQIRGVPIDIESELKQLISESPKLALDIRESSPGLTNDMITKTINNTYRQPIDSDTGATGIVIEEDRILYIQKCLHGEYYYEPCEIYGDTDKTTTIMAHSTDTCSLCEQASMATDIPVQPDDSYNQWLLEENRRMAYQGHLDQCSDYNVFEIDLEEAQKPLKPSIRPPAVEDWERMRKYFGYFPAKVVRTTWNLTTFLSPTEKIQITQPIA